MSKIIHWLVFIAFLGLSFTALAADYFFSKEAIMDSFKISLPMVNANIHPVDQLFIARIERRNTWDTHFYFGLMLSFLTMLWFLIIFIKKEYSNLFLKIVLFVCVLMLSTSGVLMFLRLYEPLSEETFKLLKSIHHFGYYAFVLAIIFHIAYVIFKENRNHNTIGKMFRFLSVAFVVVNFSNNNLLASNDFMRQWSNDQNYINGVMYMEGDKGAKIFLKEIENCPYEKCSIANIDKSSIGTKFIPVTKPDYKEAIKLLSISAMNGNVLASERLLAYLIKQIDYKSKYPDPYLLNLLKVNTNLNFEEYKTLVNSLVKKTAKTNKSCLAYYHLAEFFELGLLGNPISEEEAKINYNNAYNICPEKNIYKMLALTKKQKGKK